MQGGTASGIVNGHLFMAGGRDESDATLDMTWDYDIADRHVDAEAEHAQSRRTSPAASWLTASSGSIGGGRRRSRTPFDGTTGVESFDPATNTWSPEPDVDVAALVPGGTRRREHALRGRRPRRSATTSLSTVETLDAGRPATTSTASAATASASTSASAASASASASAASAASTTSASATTAPPPPPPPPPPARCRVPRVLGLRLNAAKRRIRASALLGRHVRRVRSRRSLRGRVVKQTPRPGTIKRRNFPVKLAVGRS